MPKPTAKGGATKTSKPIRSTTAARESPAPELVGTYSPGCLVEPLILHLWPIQGDLTGVLLPGPVFRCRGDVMSGVPWPLNGDPTKGVAEGPDPRLNCLRA